MNDDLRLSVPISRRGLLQLAGAAAGLVFLPRCKSSSAPAYRFLTPTEVAGLGVLADTILPPDQDPGGNELGTCSYVDRLLSAFEGGGPIWAGGPYSGRAPEPTADGSPSAQFPSDDFMSGLPMDRVHKLYWRYLIYGSATQPGPNDALDGVFPGYRTILRNGLADATALAQTTYGFPLEKLEVPNAVALVQTLLADEVNWGARFIKLVMTFVAQACFAAPEYGGNTNQGGWKIAHWEGDRQPLGFSWYDPATQSYREDPASPVSTANPLADPDPIDPQTAQLVALTAATQT